MLQIIITAVGPKDSTYEQFLAALPENEPRFAGACPLPSPFHAPPALAASSASSPDNAPHVILQQAAAIALINSVFLQCTTTR